MALLRKMHVKRRLTINLTKSTVARVFRRRFIGFSFWVAPKREIQCGVAAKLWAIYTQRIRQLTRRSGA